jgi:hypothetical protein
MQGSVATRRRLCALAMTGGVLAAACREDVPDPVAPPPPDVAGLYEATAFFVTVNGVTENVLAGGGSLTMELFTNKTLGGRMLIPRGSAYGQATDQTLVGVWDLAGTVVTLQFPSGGSLLAGIPLHAKETALMADHLLNGGMRVRLTLTRQSLTAQ